MELTGTVETVAKNATVGNEADYIKLLNNSIIIAESLAVVRKWTER